jgi:hypothetical protein
MAKKSKRGGQGHTSQSSINTLRQDLMNLEQANSISKKNLGLCDIVTLVSDDEQDYITAIKIIESRSEAINLAEPAYSQGKKRSMIAKLQSKLQYIQRKARANNLEFLYRQEFKMAWQMVQAIGRQ